MPLLPVVSFINCVSLCLDVLNALPVFPSELASAIISARRPEEELPGDPRFTPSRRIGTDEEISGAILYLTSRAGAFTNGTVFTLDGGRLSVIPSTY